MTTSRIDDRNHDDTSPGIPGWWIGTFTMGGMALYAVALQQFLAWWIA